MKKSTKFIIGGTVFGAIVSPFIYGTYKVMTSGCTKIDPDQLYFSDEEIEKIEKQARHCHSRACCEEFDLSQPQAHSTDMTNISDEDAIETFTKLIPSNQKYCDSVVDIINVASTSLDRNQRGVILNAFKNVISAIGNEIVNSEIATEDADDFAKTDTYSFDGVNFKNADGVVVSDEDMSNIFNTNGCVKLDLTPAISSKNFDFGGFMNAQEEYKSENFNPIQFLRSYSKERNE